jgi:hypothetical protein
VNIEEKDPRFRNQKFREKVREKLGMLGLESTFANFKKFDRVWNPSGWLFLDWMDEAGPVTIVQCVDEDGLRVGKKMGLLDFDKDFDPKSMVVLGEW